MVRGETLKVGANEFKGVSWDCGDVGGDVGGDDDGGGDDGGGGDDDIGVVVDALVQCGPYLQNLIIVSDFRHLQQIYSNFNFWC